jgi:hypothetical protein
MKNLLLFIVTIVLILSISSCRKDIAPSYSVEMDLEFPDGFDLADMPDGIDVSMQNTATGRETILTTGVVGDPSSTLIEGNYNISCSFSITVNNTEYTFNGSINNYFLAEESIITMELSLASNTGGFILKEIYFAGSATPENKTYLSDQFHEVYNNSSDTLYADGLCIGYLEQLSSKANIWINGDGSFLDRLALKTQVWIVPGDGDDYPVYPGESLVIAQDGINHKSDENGNPNSPVDLGNADWETYVEISGKDLDAPGVANLKMMYTTSASTSDWVTMPYGSAAFLLSAS